MPSYKLPALVIANAGTASGTLGPFNWADSITIMGDVTGLTGTINVEVADIEPASVVAGDYRTLQSGGADITVTVDDATVILNTGFKSLRLLSSAAEGAERTFDIICHEPAAAFNRHS